MRNFPCFGGNFGKTPRTFTTHSGKNKNIFLPHAYLMTSATWNMHKVWGPGFQHSWPLLLQRTKSKIPEHACADLKAKTFITIYVAFVGNYVVEASHLCNKTDTISHR